MNALLALLLAAPAWAAPVERLPEFSAPIEARPLDAAASPLAAAPGAVLSRPLSLDPALAPSIVPSVSGVQAQLPALPATASAVKPSGAILPFAVPAPRAEESARSARTTLAAITDAVAKVSEGRDAGQALDALFQVIHRGETDGPQAAPPFPADMTFSLELEYLVKRQLNEASLRSLFASDPLSPQEWALWRDKGALRADRWEKARQQAVARVEGALDPHWNMTVESKAIYNRPSGGNTMEIRTAGENGVYHENDAAHWSALTASLSAVQDALPGGLYSVHAHVGRKSWTRGKKLNVDPRRAARLAWVYQGFWRALAGLPYQDVPDEAANAALALDPSRARAKEYVGNHMLGVNLSDKFPTVENKMLSGLMGPDKRLNPERLREDLWMSFAFFDAITRAKQIPVATMGAPVLGGTKPSLKQAARFIDVVFAGDEAGKAIALQRLAKTHLVEEPSQEVFPVVVNGQWVDSHVGLAAAARKSFARVGLGVVFDLHQAHEGYDEDLAAHLLEHDGRLLQQLGEDLNAAGIDRLTVQSYFPVELHRPVLEAMGLSRDD